jgi:Uma2 family endonuclease
LSAQREHVMSATITKPMTADELLAMPDDGYRYELVEGELRRMSPAGDEHGLVGMELAIPLGSHVKKNKLGKLYLAETGFLIKTDPDTVRAPDIAFVRMERIKETPGIKGYRVGAPDLAVEVVSPGDTVSEIEEKVAEWLEGGARMVLVVSPKLHTVTVYRSLTDIVTLTEKDKLDGADVVPGFQMNVVEIFA